MSERFLRLKESRIHCQHLPVPFKRRVQFFRCRLCEADSVRAVLFFQVYGPVVFCALFGRKHCPPFNIFGRIAESSCLYFVAFRLIQLTPATSIIFRGTFPKSSWPFCWLLSDALKYNLCSFFVTMSWGASCPRQTGHVTFLVPRVPLLRSCVTKNFPFFSFLVTQRRDVRTVHFTVHLPKLSSKCFQTFTFQTWIWES